MRIIILISQSLDKQILFLKAFVFGLRVYLMLPTPFERWVLYE